MHAKLKSLLLATLLVFAASGTAHANLVWPALFLETRLFTWWTISFGLVIEYLFVRKFFGMAPRLSVKATLAANAFSAGVGLPLIPISGLIWELFPGSIYMKLLNWGTFNPVTWVATILLACVINCGLESFVYRRWFALQIGRREFLWVAAANAISVGLAGASLFLVPPHQSRFDEDRSLKDCLKCDYTLAGFDFKRQVISDVQIVQRFGEGCPKFIEFDGKSHLAWRDYGFPSQGVEARFNLRDRYVGLTLKRSNGSSPDCLAKGRLSSLETKRGIALGDSEGEIRKVYGEPRWVIDKFPPQKRLLYSSVVKREHLTSEDTMFIDLLDGKVASIEVSIVE